MVKFKISDLWRSPELNPISRKARSIPCLNPVNVHGRVFFFSWFGFMMAFWAWYAFPPLLFATIKSDLHLTATQVANSNIMSLCATLLIRAGAGPLCDEFGPRWVFGVLLLLGGIPVGLAPLVQNAQGLYVSRFFIGILGGVFVPCQVWTTGFFDKNVVGTANALTGGWGNFGGGVTYFVMPAIFDSFVGIGRSNGQAWRLTFIAPTIMLIAIGTALLLLCPDTPTGRWSERKKHVQENLQSHGVECEVPVTSGEVAYEAETAADSRKQRQKQKSARDSVHEVVIPKDEMLQTAEGETISKPTPAEVIAVTFSLQTWYHVLTYACSFGAELTINATLGAYYLQNFPRLGQTRASDWAAMFGFMNLVTRPLGGIVSDLLYGLGGGHNLCLKKGWIALCGVLAGATLIIIGKMNPRDDNSSGSSSDSNNMSTMTGLLALAAFFVQGGNGANFALVPHVHPFANGIVSGLAGAGGNVGGVVFAVIFRFMGDGADYAAAFWVIGCIHVAVNVLTLWIPPIPRGQIGGH